MCTMFNLKNVTGYPLSGGFIILSRTLHLTYISHSENGLNILSSPKLYFIRDLNCWFVFFYIFFFLYIYNIILIRFRK